MVQIRANFLSQQIGASFWCNIGQIFLECTLVKTFLAQTYRYFTEVARSCSRHPKTCKAIKKLICQTFLRRLSSIYTKTNKNAVVKKKINIFHENGLWDSFVETIKNFYRLKSFLTILKYSVNEIMLLSLVIRQITLIFVTNVSVSCILLVQLWYGEIWIIVYLLLFWLLSEIYVNKQPTPASHGCLFVLWFKITNTSLISLDIRNYLQQKHENFTKIHQFLSNL